MPAADIVIRGAREHNLRGVDLVLPRNKLVVMTGVSGSGKSSLAFDTLYAEGQRRYVESLSAYARQFLGQMPKPDVDAITGLAPSISIQQKTAGRNPRSTVGTITEIADYLRVLYARIGEGRCVRCDRPITAQSTDRIVESIARLPDATRFQILAPLVRQQKGEYRDLCDDLRKQGFLRARIDGRFVNLSDDLQLDRQMKHTVELVVDRLVAGTTSRSRLAEAVALALDKSGGTLIVVAESAAPPSNAAPASIAAPDPTASPAARKGRARRGAAEPFDEPPASSAPAATETFFSARYACAECGLGYEQPSPQLFSFNSPQGMCPDCNGLGVRHDFVLDRLVPDATRSVAKGAIELFGPFKDIGKWRRHIYDGAARSIETAVGLPADTLLKTPWGELPDRARHEFLYGTGDRNVTFAWRHSGGIWKHGGTWAGVVAELLDDFRKTSNAMRRKQLEKYLAVLPCHACRGTRLNPQARAVRIASDDPRFVSSHDRTDLSLPEVCALPISDAFDFFGSLRLDDTGRQIATEVLREIRGRLGFLLRCGLDYLTLDRTAPTLSGGESQRIRLASQIGCGLVGVVYILDEPSIGLHPRDNRLLLESLCDLRDRGNTVVVVEHDEETMRAADHLVDFGPGPGVRGGEVVAQGSLSDVLAEPRSLTGQYLSGRTAIAVPERRRAPGKRKLVVRGARHHNLRGIDVEFPLESFVCVTGVSGSGKSSLVEDILWAVLDRDLNGAEHVPGAHDRIDGLEHLDKAIDIDQSPIGRTPRSNPATYVKLFDAIRDLYAQLPESKARGYAPGRFSFNVPGGRCEACEGHGANKLEMDFLADIWTTCPVCEGRRFGRETLDVRFKGRSIAEVLDLDVQEAMKHFENVPGIARLLQTLADVGLDYLKLGQPSPTLSGGEAQRIKLARELGKRSTGRTIYLLDEPTTGLHFADVHKLLEVLHGFVAAGNTVVVVEHNLDVIKTADCVIDLGPEGGAGGGTVVVAGTPEEVAACPASHTGKALVAVLATNGRIAPLDSAKLRTDEVLPKTKGRGRRAKDVTLPAVRSVARSTPPETSTVSETTAAADALRARTAVPSVETDGNIVVRGAAQHNLQHVDVDVPRDAINVFCGPSGSGKTSLAMDTLYAEGQRRYVESLSSYARQFLGQMPKPRVEHVHGLSPAIAIEQKSAGHTPRSTVGTVTEIHDHLRVLYARLGKQFCPDCNVPVETQTVDQVVDRLLELPAGTQLLLLAPQEVPVGQKHEALWERLKGQGFLRVRIDGTTCRLDEVPAVDRRRKHQVEIVVDRVTVDPGRRSRLGSSVESAFGFGKGALHVARVDAALPESEWPVDRFSLRHACGSCGRSFEEPAPHHFSFNSPVGWCPACEGLGVEQGSAAAPLVRDPALSLAQGALLGLPSLDGDALVSDALRTICAAYRIPLDVPFGLLPPPLQRVLLYGTGDLAFEWRPGTKEEASSSKAPARRKSSKKSGAPEAAATPAPHSAPPVRIRFKGLYPAVEEASRVSYAYRQSLQELVGSSACSVCRGSRLRDAAAAVRFEGLTIHQLSSLPLAKSLEVLRGAKLDPSGRRVAGDLLGEAVSRLAFLVDVGLHYLTLGRPLPTLSGGEMQRIRLAGQIGRALTGVLYVLDEPTIGLHPRDNGRLIEALRRLRDLGNTLVLVEHDREVIAAADRLYDFGPGAGRHGGTIVASGTPRDVSNDAASLTGKYLSGRESIPVPTQRRMPDGGRDAVPPGGGWLELVGARLNNLRDVDLRIPLGTLVCVTGVSGSGKSSLVEETLARAVARRLHRSGDAPGPFDALHGIERIDKAIVVDQQPLGNTPASNPATYTGVFDQIRELFARLPESRVRGFRPGRFSFNRPGGRCEACEGNGQKRIEMHFLPDVWIECDTCRGKRYDQATLAAKYRGRSIADVLEMSIGEAAELFDDIPALRRPLATLCAIGLDYLRLGQSAPTLSGGEAQRVKLAAELARPDTGRTLYLLDEPTTGLHFDDVAKLLKVLGSLVAAGNTVVVVEHNLDVVKSADWVIDLGPEAGADGGWIVAQGTPEDVVAQALRVAPGASSGNAPPVAVPPRPAKRKSKKDAPAPHAPEASSSNGSASPNGTASSTESLLRSFTGEMLAPVLAAARRADLETFDVQEVGRKRTGDVDLRHVGRETKMPWQADGRRWHVADRTSHQGKPCRWEGAALEKVTDRIAELGGLAEPNWGDRSTVEIQADSKEGGWFLHALTGDEWLLVLKFRVGRGTFDEATLARRLGLRALDDLDELPVYGRVPRVRVTHPRGPWQEVAVTVHWLREIDTPEFDDFLCTARESYLARIAAAARLDVADLTPWKVLGRKWHLTTKGFPGPRRAAWAFVTLESLFAVLELVAPDVRIDWTRKTSVVYTLPDGSGKWAEVHTKRREGIDLELACPPGRFALGRIAALGHEREIRTDLLGEQTIRIRFVRPGEVAAPDLKVFLAEHLAACRE